MPAPPPPWTPRDTWLLAGLLVLALALRLPLVSRLSYDLEPRPDALEYGAVARQVARGEGLALALDGRAYPSRYPCGTSLLLVPAVWLAGGDPAYAFVEVLALGILGVALTYLLGRRAGGPVCAAFAAFVLCICPRHASLSTLVMSEIPSTTAVLALLLYFLWWWERPRRAAHLLVLGAGAAAAASIRWANLLLLVPVGLALLASRRPRRGRELAVLALGTGLGLVPELAYRVAFFGAPTRTGYHFWEPDAYTSWRTSYNPAFLLESARPEWEFGNLQFYARGLSGYRSALLTPVTALTALLGMAWVWRHRRGAAVGRVLLWFPLATVLFYLPYFFRDQRMNTVIVPELGVLAGLTLERAAALLRARAARAVLIAAVALGSVLGIGWGDDGGVGAELVRNAASAQQTRRRTMHRELRAAGAALPPGSVLIADAARLQLAPYLPAGTDVINLADDTGRDEEVRLIYRHDLPSLDGDPRKPRVLFHGGELVAPVVDFLEQAQAAGRPIQLWVRKDITPAWRFAESFTQRFTLEPLGDPAAAIQRAQLRLRRP